MQDSTFFQTQLARIRQSGSLDTLVYLGIGNAGPDAVQACLDSGARHILLTEADPERAAALKPACAAAGTRLRTVAVAEEAGQSPFYLFNFRSLSSCRRPDGLDKIFPGLRQTGTVQVETAPLAGLLDLPGRAADGPGLLAVDCPGQEAMILRQLLALEQLGGFRYLYLRLPAAALYEDSLPMEEILQLLEAAGWRLRHTDARDPDFPACFLELDPLALQAAALQADLAEARAALQDSSRQAQRLEAETRRQAQALEEAAEARSAAEAEAGRLAARNAELEAETRRQAQALEEAAAARSAAEAEAGRLTARNAELEAETRRQAQALEEAAAAAKARQAAAEKAEAAEAEARQSLAVALRLQSRRDADLKELQMRYSTLQQQQEAQEDLLRRTSACLGYLMDDSAPEEARPVLAAAALKSSSAS